MLLTKPLRYTLHTAAHSDAVGAGIVCDRISLAARQVLAELTAGSTVGFFFLVEVFLESTSSPGGADCR